MKTGNVGIPRNFPPNGIGRDLQWSGRSQAQCQRLRFLKEFRRSGYEGEMDSRESFHSTN